MKATIRQGVSNAIIQLEFGYFLLLYLFTSVTIKLAIGGHLGVNLSPTVA